MIYNLSFANFFHVMGNKKLEMRNEKREIGNEKQEVGIRNGEAGIGMPLNWALSNGKWDSNEDSRD